MKRNSKKSSWEAHKNLPILIKVELVALLKENSNLFAWTTMDMPGVDLEFMSHRLSVSPGFYPVIQKKRRMSLERALMMQE